MTRDAEVTALRAVEYAYQRWTVVSEQLHQEVAEAAERDAGAPVEALRADFNAQVAVTRSVAAFARSCSASGPDVKACPAPRSSRPFIRSLQASLTSTRTWWPWASGGRRG